MIGKKFRMEIKRFEEMSDEQLFEAAKTALLDFDNSVREESEGGVALFYRCVAASLKLGFGTGSPSEKQMRFAKDLYAEISAAKKQPERYNDLLCPVCEEDYKTAAVYNRLGILPIGRDMLYLLLCAAHVDGNLSDASAAKLDPVFKELFRYYSEDTALDNIPAYTNNVYGLDAQIMDLLFKKGEWMSFGEIKLSFPNESIEEVQDALNWLCSRGILNYYYNVIGEPYSPAVSRNRIRLDLSSAAGKNADYLERLEQRQRDPAGTRYKIAEATFTPGGRRYDYLYDIPLQVGDRCVVEANGEEKTVTVVRLTEKKESELARPLLMCKTVLRKADE